MPIINSSPEKMSQFPQRLRHARWSFPEMISHLAFRFPPLPLLRALALCPWLEDWCIRHAVSTPSAALAFRSQYLNTRTGSPHELPAEDAVTLLLPPPSVITSITSITHTHSHSIQISHSFPPTKPTPQQHKTTCNPTSSPSSSSASSPLFP
jgi:hypothetical protein